MSRAPLARAVAARLGAPILSLDSYYRDLPHLDFEERARTNFDVPDALDHELLSGHLRALAAGAGAEVPIYDFATHRRRETTESLCAGDFGVVEGLWTLFERRLLRDTCERGRSNQSVCEQYAATVRPMADLYVLPTRHFADLVLSGTDPLDRLAERVAAHALQASR